MIGLFRILLLFIIALLLFSCWGSNRATYNSPPPRTVSLDSTKTDAGDYRLVPEPDSILVAFIVPGDTACHARVGLYNGAHKLERLLADSVYSPGLHQIFWDRRDGKGELIKPLRAYYYMITVCDSTYHQSFLYRQEYY